MQPSSLLVPRPCNTSHTPMLHYIVTPCALLHGCHHSPQDTRRLLSEELASIKSEVQRIEATAKYESDRARADELGWGDLSRLAEQLAQTEAKLDRSKQAKYFPEARGYKCVVWEMNGC